MLSSLTVRPSTRTRPRPPRRGTTTVDLAQDRVQQWGELDGLAVGAADQGRRDAVAGSRHLPDQLDAVRAVQDSLCRPCTLGGHTSVVTVGCH